jgi:hypothetical protein
MSLRKAEQEVEKTEKKYHEATKDVELTRQLCDAEMCRVSSMFFFLLIRSFFFVRVVIKCKQWKSIE